MQKTTFTSAPDEIAKLLEEAAARGHLVMLRTSPPPDDVKTARLVALNQIFDLTLTESRIIAALLEHNFVGQEALCAALTHDGRPVPSSANLRVVISRLRKKLAPFGIAISTVWGQGYRITGRDRINQTVAAYETTGTPPAAAPSD
jgi:DNA-binding winged helix-turn-helix (wHTH) protein